MGRTLLGCYDPVNCAPKLFPNQMQKSHRDLRKKLKTGLNEQPDLYLDIEVIFRVCIFFADSIHQRELPFY